MRQSSALRKALNAVRFVSASCQSYLKRLRAAWASWVGRVQNGNPLLYLFVKTWHYSAGNRARVVLFWAMFMTAEIVELIFPPLIIAEIMNVVQKDGLTRRSLTTLLL